MAGSPVFTGVDVSKARLDVACTGSDEAWSCANAPEGISELVARLSEVGPALVVMEATGGFEVPVAAALAAAEIPVVIANPRQVRDSREPRDSSPKPMRSTPTSSLSLPSGSAPRCDSCRTKTPARWTRS